VAVLGLVVVPVVAGAAWAGGRSRVGTTIVGVVAVAVALVSLAAPTAASALHPAWSAATLLWGSALLAVTWIPRGRP
jgi:hypothetical protein